jgi:hypothetical protein
MVGLGDLDGSYFRSVAAAVSADGSTIVGNSSLSRHEDWAAFIWDAEHGMRNLRDVLINEYGLGSSLEGWRLITANDISADGRTIVGIGIGPAGQQEAWLIRLNELTDIIPTSLTWNIAQGGIDFSYAVTAAALEQDTTAALYWASGPTIAEALQLATAPFPVASSQGPVGLVHVTEAELFDVPPPVGTKYLLLVMDPDDLISESTESNNFVAVSLVEKVIANSVTHDLFNLSNTGQPTTVKLTFTPNFGFTLDEVSQLAEVDHFNWFNFIVAVPSHWTVNIFDNGSQIIGQALPPIPDPVPGVGLRYALDSGLAQRQEFIVVKPPFLPDDAPFYYNEGDAELQDYTFSDRLEFFDQPKVPKDFLADGEYWQFQTLLAGVRDDGSWITWDGIGTNFSWRSNLTTSWEGGIFLKVPDVGTLPADASGGIFDLRSDSPATALSAIS